MPVELKASQMMSIELEAVAQGRVSALAVHLKLVEVVTAGRNLLESVLNVKLKLILKV
jgi:hypothetical protein